MDTPESPRALLWTKVALVAGAIAVALPLWPWLLLAIWASEGARRMMAPVAGRLGGRHRAAAAITVLLILGTLTPVVLLLIPIARDALSLLDRLRESESARQVFSGLVSGGAGESMPNSSTAFLNLLESYGASAWLVLSRVATVASEVAVGLFVVGLGTYEGLVHGPRAWAWVKRHAPLSERNLSRLSAAFHETGRGLFLGTGGAGAVQAIIATVAYAALGVPRPFVLGLLTFFVSVIPSVGTALVWVPVTIGFALTGRPVAAVVMAILGVFVIGAVDNILRPMLARRGALELPSFVVLVGMLGGFAAFGAWGLLLGPLLLRLAKEALELSADEVVISA